MEQPVSPRSRNRTPPATDLSAVLSAIAKTAAQLCEARDSLIFLVDGDQPRLVAKHGPIPQPQRPGGPPPISRQTPLGRALLTRRAVHVRDVKSAASRRDFPAIADMVRALPVRTVLAMPMFRDGAPLGGIVIRRTRVQPFTAKQIALLKTFADQAAIAIENARLSTELETRNRALAESLEQQTATSEILRVIARSPADVQPVFDAIVRSAVRLCGAAYGGVYRFDGELIHSVAHDGFTPEQLDHWRSSWPRPITGSGPTPQAIRSRSVVRIADVEADSGFELPPEMRANLRARGARSILTVPMFRQDQVIGAISLAHRTVDAFPEAHVELLRTFTDQAVIAIENARLFTELQARNQDLTTALDQQTATADILRIISRSYMDVRPVFQAIVDSASRLLRGHSAVLSRIVEDQIELAAYTHTDAAGDALLESFFPVPLHPSESEPRPIRDRVIGQRAPYNVADVETDPRVGERGRAGARARGYRSQLVVPMLRDGEPIGTIAVTRREPGAFTDDETALLQTFADQAVIAVENVRLFTELQARNAALAEALEQQTATSEILRVISSSPTDVQPVLDAVAEAAARLCSADDAVIRRVDGDMLRLWAHHGDIPVPQQDMPLTPALAIGSAVLEKRTVHVHDVTELVQNVEHVELRAFLQQIVRARTVLAAPLVRDDVSIGVIFIRRMEVRPFTDKQIQLLQTFADQAVIAIENVRLFKELQARNRELMETLARETATGDVLRAISRAQTDAQPVFDIIAESAQRLCGAGYGQVALYDGALLHMTAFHNVIPEGVEALRRRFPAPADGGSAMGRALQTRSVVEIPDVGNDPTYAFKNELQTMGFQSLLVVPMLRNDEPIGAIAVGRRERGAFPNPQVELLKTFANQAVIAIENVRLFKELEARTEDLSRSVDELRALGEVGQAISSTLDLRTVLSTIVGRATQLSGTDAGVIYEYDEQREVFVPRAVEHLEAEIVETMLATPVRKGEGATGRLADDMTPIQVPDVMHAPVESRVRGALVRAGYRALLAVPLVREDRLIGGLTVIRKSVGKFSPEIIELLTTFAAQSAIAIHNARLFRELEAKGRELETASRHKSQFLANMSHELRTPMNAIIGYTELIADGIYGSVPDPMRDVLTRVDASGRHLLGLINDVLDLSKIEAGQLTLTLAEYSMKEVTDAVVAAVEALATEKSLRLVVDMAPDLPTGRGDQRRLAQVLLNLVGNAIKFTEKGQVTIRVGAAAELFTMAVSDTGPGIAVADQERIFEEFQQADTSTTRPKGGTGLGLAIARRIVALHGGRIWVESVPGEGATFRFTMPIRVDQQAVLRTAAS